jgi:hypothetical protein
MLAVHHDPLLAEDVLLLLRVHDVLLLQTLEGVSLALLFRDLRKLSEFDFNIIARSAFRLNAKYETKPQVHKS